MFQSGLLLLFLNGEQIILPLLRTRARTAFPPRASNTQPAAIHCAISVFRSVQLLEAGSIPSMLDKGDARLVRGSHAVAWAATLPARPLGLRGDTPNCEQAPRLHTCNLAAM